MKICYLGDITIIHTRKWAKHFASRGHKVHVVSMGRGDLEGVTVHFLKQLPGIGKLNFLWNLNYVRNLIQLIDPEILHVHHASSYGMLSLCAARKVPIVVTCHGSDILVFPRNPAFKKLLQAVLKRAAVINSVAAHITNTLITIGADQKKVVTTQYGLDLEQISSIRPKRLDTAETVIISTRQLKPIYRVDTLIEATPKLKTHSLSFKLVVVGGGPEEMRIRKLAQELGVQDDVIFTGLVEHQTVISLLKGADVYVSTSLSDGSSLCLLEALACRLFPVVTDIPANRAIIAHGQNGFLVPVDAPDCLADKIIEAMHFERKGQALETNYAYIAAQPTMDETFARMETIYDDLASRHSKG